MFRWHSKSFKNTSSLSYVVEISAIESDVSDVISSKRSPKKIDSFFSVPFLDKTIFAGKINGFGH